MLLASLLFGMMSGFPVKKKPPPPEPEKRISLAELGMRGRPTSYALKAGRAYATLNFLDNRRVLLTFPLARALPRDDAGEAHADHLLRMEIVDIESGRVELAHELTVHDRSAYLWPLGENKFLLRSGSSLFLLDERLEPTLLLQQDAPVRWVQADAVANLFVLVVERERHTPKEHAQMEHDALLHNAPPPTEDEDAYGFRITPMRESVFHSRIPVAGPVAATDRYWLRAEPEAGERYQVRLQPWQNEASEQVAHITSSCRPALKMMTRDMAVAIACAGEDQRLVAFHIEQDKKGKYAGSELWTAPEHGVSRVDGVQATPADGLAVLLLVDEVEGEEHGPTAGRLQVLDTESGRARLEVPVQGFFGLSHIADVSPDGSTLAALRDGALELYRIPPALPAPKKK